MFEKVVDGLAAIRSDHPWVAPVASILPLSALIDFIDVPLKLHALQLTGATPLWSWAITPSGSRLLLSDGPARKSCYLDQFGNTVGLIGLDGRWGDQYFLPGPETVRLCLGSQPLRNIPNPHKNMEEKDLRLQTLEIVHVKRLVPDKDVQSSPPRLGRHALMHSVRARMRRYSARYMATTGLGWIALVGLIFLGVISKSYLAVAFLIVVPLSGSVVSLIHGYRPRRLLVTGKTEFNRLVVVAENMNTSDWIAFYGESTIINSLLNRPLEPNGDKGPSSWLTRITLRILILGQWALVVGAAALGDWNAYYISFWIIFGIFAFGYMIPPRIEVAQWMKSSARIRIERYSTDLSSRRALLNTIMALNPDTFPLDQKTRQEDRTVLFPGALKWINPILEPGPGRSRWEEATRAAMAEGGTVLTEEQLKSPLYWDREGSFLSSEWRETYKQKSDYWRPYIGEGICMAAKIKSEARLTGRYLDSENA